MATGATLDPPAEAEAPPDPSLLGVGSEPGENGIATQPEDEYSRPEVSEADEARARQVWEEAKDRGRDYGAERMRDACMQIIDVLPELRCPTEWPAAEEDEYAEAPQIFQIAVLLLKACPKLTLSPKNIQCMWRNKAKWTSGGRTVRGNAKSLDTRSRFLVPGDVRVIIEINYAAYRTFNPLQMTAAIYHELRRHGSDGERQAFEFEGYFDEIEVFGLRTWREMIPLHNAAKVAHELEIDHQLSLLDGPDDETAH